MRRQGLPLSEIAQDWVMVRELADAENTVEAKIDDLVRAACAVHRLRESEPSERSFPAVLEGITTADLSPELVTAVVADVGRHYGRSTTARTLSTFRVFCRWMTKKGYLSSNPCEDDDIKLPRLDLSDGDYEKVHAFTAEDVTAMLKAAATPTSSPRASWPVRDVAIVQTLAGCGVRASELVGLQVRHVDRAHRRPLLRVVAGTKGSKPRAVPIPRETLASIDDYLVERTNELGSPEATARLFVRRDGSSMNRALLDRLVRRVAKDAGVKTPGDAATHAYRHFYGVHLARSGLPVPTLQQLMGHADSRTTARYTRISEEGLADDLEDVGWL